jgi:hypothetical protein
MSSNFADERCPQHFLRTTAPRSLCRGQVLRLFDEEAHAKFIETRWSDHDGHTYWLHCGNVEVYCYRSRPNPALQVLRQAIQRDRQHDLPYQK